MNFGIATRSEAAYSAHQVIHRARKSRDIVELVQDNNFDTLSEHDKYIVLKNRFVQAANFDFPKTIKYGCNRSCKTAYLSDSFVYSCHDNAVCCIYCVLFFPKYRRNILGAFVNRGYREWLNIMEKEKKHSQNTYHHEAMTLDLATIDRFEKPERTIFALIDNSIKQRYESHPIVMHAISRVIHLIGEQGIALRGHRKELDDSKPDNNPDNFLSILTEVANYYPVLEEPFRSARGAVSKRCHIS